MNFEIRPANANADEVAALAAVLLALRSAQSATPAPATDVARPKPASRWRAAGRMYGGELAR